jgi:hypothetical protein
MTGAKIETGEIHLGVGWKSLAASSGVRGERGGNSQ